MQTFNSKDNLSSASDIIDALHNILRSQVVMSDLTTPLFRVSVPNTYLPTTDSNSESISTILAERQQQLDAVSYEISGLETVMDNIKILHQQLVERKENIKQSMTFHKGLRSALWRLPTEVLHQIFSSLICRPWREVAVDMPSLWCRLHVEFNVTTARVWEGDVDHGDWQRAVFHYDSWLKRARGRPLSIALERYDSTVLLGNLLQPYMDQISFLSICFSRGAGKPQLLLKDMPALRELVILNMHGCDIPAMMEYISQLPSTMHVLDIMYSPFDINLLSSLDPDAFLHLLRLCPNLSSLTVEANFDRQQTLEPFTHANLQSLCLNCADEEAFLAHLFDALSLPSLRMFDACVWAADEIRWPHKQLIDLFARSNCPLERLSFRGFTVMDVQRAKYVALIPSLDVVESVPVALEFNRNKQGSSSHEDPFSNIVVENVICGGMIVILVLEAAGEMRK
ncbi:uncharacterized protein F5147DRAFT_788312 [Suillus discolor]|uniref:F-box domain-containing protein n=1 Tax=Suillus discolor TaxID=1912936 RepID=A0A9P7JMF9_9AGAM|nr:uncharacterized protein F5147DRAFT_788312 [Suillus discolor]KAG2089462.1 hypothetical protein F5147DRAFT_788312 [Suillus discolor]